MIKRSGVCGKNYEFFASEEEFMRKAAKTPRSNCVLDSTKAIAVGLRLSPVLDMIDKSLRTWSSHSVQ
jgi:hypothetical protein